MVAGVLPGMGLALARRFAADGCGVALIARHADALAGCLRDVGPGAASGRIAARFAALAALPPRGRDRRDRARRAQPSAKRGATQPAAAAATPA